MDVRLGISQSPKELLVELGDDADGAKVHATVDKALKAGDGMFWLTDRRGREVGVPVSKLSYIEIAGPDTTRRVGFGS